MSNAYRDENSVPTLIGVLNTDGTTIERITIDPSTHRLQMNDGITGSNLGPTNSKKDENDISSMMAVSDSDGQTPVVLYVDSSGNLLVQST